MRNWCGSNQRSTAAFTLIELSIVLVIIGLIIGGILVGQDLITAAATRAQIAQVEKYNSAVNTFRNKYGGIPGDLIYSSASQFGFSLGANSLCTGAQGSRDRNGLLDGVPGTPWYLYQGEGETSLFWADLSTAGMIDGSFTAPSVVCVWGGWAVVMSATMVPNYYPTAKIGHGNYMYIYEDGIRNWFGVLGITGNSANGCFANAATTSIPVTQAYNLDKKIDDGIPTSGSVLANYVNCVGGTIQIVPAPNASSDTSSTCYNSSTNTYSTSVSNGSGPNCALSIQMQGAAR